MNPRRRQILNGAMAIGSASLWALLPSTLRSAPVHCSPVLKHTIRPLMGAEAVTLCEAYAGQVLLIVNTASKCGFTHQFDELEALYQRYQARGFQVLGFPSDDFRQELDTEQAVAEFCQLNYGVTFPMFQKLGVTAQTAHPLFRDLAAASGEFPAWNFNKYLVSRKGEVKSMYASSVRPLGHKLVGDLEALL